MLEGLGNLSQVLGPYLQPQQTRYDIALRHAATFYQSYVQRLGNVEIGWSQLRVEVRAQLLVAGFSIKEADWALKKLLA